MRPHLLVLAFLLCACAANPGRKNYKYAGIITGSDTVKCSCCNGYAITIEDKDTLYRFYSFPANTPFDTTIFPVHVYLDYDETGVCENIHRVVIKDIQQQYRNSYSSAQ